MEKLAITGAASWSETSVIAGQAVQLDWSFAHASNCSSTTVPQVTGTSGSVTVAFYDILSNPVITCQDAQGNSYDFPTLLEVIKMPAPTGLNALS